MISFFLIKWFDWILYVRTKHKNNIRQSTDTKKGKMLAERNKSLKKKVCDRRFWRQVFIFALERLHIYNVFCICYIQNSYLHFFISMHPKILTKTLPLIIGTSVNTSYKFSKNTFQRVHNSDIFQSQKKSLPYFCEIRKKTT